MKIIQSFIEIGRAKKGDILFNYDGTEEKIESIEFISDNSPVYNLEVQSNHNYFAENVLVHNKIGSYKGSDVEVQARIDADKAAWAASQESMSMLDKQAQSLSGQYEEQSALMRDTLETSMESERLKNVQELQSSEFAAGKAGLTTGQATQDVDILAETGAKGLETSLQVGRGEQEELRLGTESALLDTAIQQGSIYADWMLGKKETKYGMTPDFQTTYQGGTSWSPTETTDYSYTPPESSFLPWGECFTGDMKVDGQDISKVQVGDMVSSYNEETRIIEKAEVVETFEHKNNSGYLVINGRIKATPNHPFYIKRIV